MHHSLKRVFMFLLTIPCLCSCSAGSIKCKLEKTAYESDTASVEILCPQFSIPHHHSFAEELNRQAREEAQEVLAEFEKKSTESRPDIEKAQLRLTPMLTYADQPLFSFYTDTYLFTEGVHGTLTRSAKTYDLNTQAQLSLSDLFERENFPEFLNQQLENELQKNSEKYHDLWEKPIVGEMHESFFYLSDAGLTLFFPPYALSYYARGFVEFTLPYTALSPYLKPEYRVLAKSQKESV